MKNFNFCIILYLFSAIFCNSVFSQPKCYFEHYGAEDGLPQHTVMGILQDKKGFMWFSTWDGLCKFDGYDFSTYKIQQGDMYHMKSNRIDHIFEDAYGNIWTLSYDKEAHRFDPKTEGFMGLKSLEEYKNTNFVTSDVVPMRSGKVWLLSDNSGCVCVVDSTFRIEVFNVENGKLTGERVYTVYEDMQDNTWILTNNGLLSISADGQKSSFYFAEKQYGSANRKQSFYTVLELPDEIWFGSSNGKIWKYSKKSGQFDLLDLECSSRIMQIKAITQDKILITTQNSGFFIYDTLEKKLDSYSIANLPNMCSNKIFKSYVDRSKNIWLELDCYGVAKFDIHTQKMEHFQVKLESSLSTVFPPNFFIFEDKESRLWVHPRGGGFSLYDKNSDRLVPFYNEPASLSWRFSNMMHAAFSDRQGNLWLSTRSHGLEKVVFDDDYFKSIIVDSEVHSSVNNDIRAIFEDDERNIWVSTKGGKIYVYDEHFNSLGFLCEDGRVGNGKSLAGVAYCLSQDKKGNIWIGTKGEGVYKATYQKDTNSYRITHYKNNPLNVYSLSDNNVYSIFQDKNGGVWIGTYGGGLNYYNESQGEQFVNHRNNLKKYPIQTGSQIRTISADAKGNVCIGTTIGLIVFSPDFTSPETIDFKTYLRIPGDNNSISGNDIFDIYTAKNGITYIATFGGGINKVSEVDGRGFPLKFQSYTTANGLPSDVTLSLVEDRDGKLWICTESNLTKFDPKKEVFETFSEIKRLMKSENFSEASRCTTSSGNILFGYTKGIILFNPQHVKNNTFNPYVALVKFRLFNKDVTVDGQSFLKENIDDINELVLKYNQNFFTIEFSALDYVDPRNILYAYKLEGFDKDWIYSQNQRTANYTNLSKGEYIFRVKSTNSDGVWSENERHLPIIIEPSFWDTPWAYAFYVILFIFFMYITLHILFVFYRMKDKVELEHQQTELKARFFTDISHEIRTPLTMIVSPIENLIHDEETPPAVKKQLSLVSKNTSRMLDMVNQILDFRKIQQQQLKLEEIPIGLFVADICNGFIKTAENQKINFEVVNHVGNEKIWIDRNHVEKIVFNLLSNAFKYTPENKAIRVSVFNKGNGIAVQVEDEGIGITKDKQMRLFKRFESFNEDKNKPSTGIGLSMVKELADKHQAKVLVESEPNVGTAFTVIFQKGKLHFKEKNTFVEETQDNIREEKIAHEESGLIEKNDIIQTETDSPGKPVVLVVEDDDDLREFIRTILEKDYVVHEAVDGKMGMEKALNLIPDLIVSDIMMPNVDGMEFLQKIRDNINTSHILFLLLTAKTTLDSKLDGLEYGADEYLTKPFDVPFFKARIKNMLERREHLQEFYQNIVHEPSKPENCEEKESIADDYTPSKLEISSRDKEFMKSVVDIIEKNIDNSDFVVEDLASSVGMSRTVFFKKIKSITGLAPIEFIRDIVIQRAAQLLETGEYSIKEVSYMVGISDSKYFSKCFKKKYNMTPREYKRQFEKPNGDDKSNDDDDDE